MTSQRPPHHARQRLQKALNWVGLCAVLGIMIYQGEGLLAYLQAEEVSLTRVVMRSLSLVGWLIVEIGYITVLRNGRK